MSGITKCFCSILVLMFASLMFAIGPVNTKVFFYVQVGKGLTQLLQTHFPITLPVYHISPPDCNSIVAFTTYWKFWYCCTHCLFGVSECQQLVCTHMFPFIQNWCYLIISNTCIMFPLTQCTIHEYKTGNDVSEFTHSNWITLSYYSSPKHKSLIPKYSIHFSHFCTQ